MRILVWIITIFALAVGLSMLISQDWGYVQFVVPQWWRVQMSTKFFVAALIVSFAVVYFLIRLIRGALSLPGVVVQWRERRRRQRADRSLREAVVTLYEGDYERALDLAGRAYKASDYPVAAILLAARAAYALCDEDRYREWLSRLDGEGEEAQIARLMTEAELEADSREFEKAAAKLEALPPESRDNTAALRLSQRVSIALERWEEALRQIRLLRKRKAVTERQAQDLLRSVHIERLRACADQGRGEDLEKMWEDIPAEEREDRQLVAEAVHFFARMGKGHAVRRTLERLLDDGWDSNLARLYGFCGDVGKGEEWLHSHREDPGLLFSLGRLCAESKLWGKAAEYFRLSLKWEPDVETHLALAHLYKRLGESDKEQEHYRAAAELAIQ